MQMFAAAQGDRIRYAAFRPCFVILELSGQLALTLAEPTLVEDVEDAGFGQLGILAGPSPVRISGNRLTLAGTLGLGFSFTG